jgi:hypothetical protein
MTVVYRVIHCVSISKELFYFDIETYILQLFFSFFLLIIPVEITILAEVLFSKIDNKNERIEGEISG